MNKLKILKILLFGGSIYYIIGAIAHYFGLTIFPWFDGNLYVPYQDTVIAFTALVLAYFLIVVARNPIKNIDMLNAIIVVAAFASIFSVAVIWKVDFISIGAPDKKLQTIVEGLLGFAWVGALLYFYPRKEN